MFFFFAGVLDPAPHFVFKGRATLCPFRDNGKGLHTLLKIIQAFEGMLCS